MNKYEVGKVLNLFISKKKQDKIFLDNDGVIGDKFYGKNINRSLLLASHDSYSLALKNNIFIADGLLGENILTNYNPYSLKVGTKLYVSDVIIEITQHCTICNSLSKIDKELPKLLEADRGVFTKVIKSGFIEVGDKIFIH